MRSGAAWSQVGCASYWSGQAYVTNYTAPNVSLNGSYDADSAYAHYSEPLGGPLPKDNWKGQIQPGEYTPGGSDGGAASAGPRGTRCLAHCTLMFEEQGEVAANVVTICEDKRCQGCAFCGASAPEAAQMFIFKVSEHCKALSSSCVRLKHGIAVQKFKQK